MPERVDVRRDLEYARVGERQLLLDLYLPKDAEKPAPVVMWIHGGGWRNGDKRRCPVRHLAGQGYAVVSVDYRLSDEAAFPAQIHDCKAAVRWIRSVSLSAAVRPAGTWPPCWVPPATSRHLREPKELIPRSIPAAYKQSAITTVRPT